MNNLATPLNLLHSLWMTPLYTYVYHMLYDMYVHCIRIQLYAIREYKSYH